MGLSAQAPTASGVSGFQGVSAFDDGVAAVALASIQGVACIVHPCIPDDNELAEPLAGEVFDMPGLAGLDDGDRVCGLGFSDVCQASAGFRVACFQVCGAGDGGVAAVALA